MYNDDYVILIDENGQPYIEHSVFSKARDAVKSAGRSAHKYVAKIGEGAKARYFYTQEELKAFYNRGKAAAAKSAETIRGAATKAATTAKSAASSVSKYASDRLGDVSDFVHRRNKAKSSETSGITDREIDNSTNKKGTHDRADSASTKRQDSITGTNFRAALDDLEPGERDKKSKKRLGRRKTNIVDIDPNTDVKGRMDSRNKTHSTDETRSDAVLDKYRGGDARNNVAADPKAQRLLRAYNDAFAEISAARSDQDARAARARAEEAWAEYERYFNSRKK